MRQTLGVVRQFEIMGEPFEIIFPISKRLQEPFSEMWEYFSKEHRLKDYS